MQPHDGPPLDLSAQVARVRAKTRPWKSIIALVLAVGAAAVSGWTHSRFHGVSQIIAATTAVAFCVFASIATIGLSGKTRSVLQPVMGVSHAAIVQYALVLIGAVTTLVVTLVLFGVPVGQLLLGGALTSVFVGIAAQQALSNVFAGMVLLLARPFKVGDTIRLRAGALSGEIVGTVSDIGITYLRLSCADGLISVPNSQVLNAVVGPLPPGDYPPPPPPAVPQAWPAGPPTPPTTDTPPVPATTASPVIAGDIVTGGGSTERAPSPDGAAGSAGPSHGAYGASSAHGAGRTGGADGAGRTDGAAGTAGAGGTGEAQRPGSASEH
jgi:Mechanosensitive ion channel